MAEQWKDQDIVGEANLWIDGGILGRRFSQDVPGRWQRPQRFVQDVAIDEASGLSRTGNNALAAMTDHVSFGVSSRMRSISTRSLPGSAPMRRSLRYTWPMWGQGPERSDEIKAGFFSALRTSLPMACMDFSASGRGIERPSNGLKVGRSASVAGRALRILSASSVPAMPIVFSSMRKRSFPQ